MQVFILSIYSQDKYLLLTRERKIEYHRSTLGELLVSNVLEHTKDNLPKLKLVERKIKEDTFIKVRSYKTGKEKIKGKFNILNDSTIMVGSETIFLNDIKKIYVKTTFSKVAGPVLIGVGVIGTIYFTPVLNVTLDLLSDEGIVAVIGVFLVPMAALAVIGSAGFVVAGILYTTIGTYYNILGPGYSSKHCWQIKVAYNESGL